MLTLPSFYCLIVHLHLDLVSNLDRLEMCKLLADIWFQKCFTLQVPLCCAQMTELWVVRGFFLLVFWLYNAEVISYLQRISCPLMPPTWDKSHAGAHQRIGLNLKAGFRCSSRESCPSWVRSVLWQESLCTGVSVSPSEAGLCCAGELCALLSGKVPLLLCSLAFGALLLLG